MLLLKNLKLNHLKSFTFSEWKQLYCLIILQLYTLCIQLWLFWFFLHLILILVDWTLLSLDKLYLLVTVEESSNESKQFILDYFTLHRDIIRDDKHDQLGHLEFKPPKIIIDLVNQDLVIVQPFELEFLVLIKNITWLAPIKMDTRILLKYEPLTHKELGLYTVELLNTFKNSSENIILDSYINPSLRDQGSLIANISTGLSWKELWTIKANLANYTWTYPWGLYSSSPIQITLADYRYHTSAYLSNTPEFNSKPLSEPFKVKNILTFNNFTTPPGSDQAPLPLYEDGSHHLNPKKLELPPSLSTPRTPVDPNEFLFSNQKPTRAPVRVEQPELIFSKTTTTKAPVRVEQPDFVFSKTTTEPSSSRSSITQQRPLLKRKKGFDVNM